jgi:hypothetical protein
VVAAPSGAGRDEHGNRIVIVGPTLARHLLDQIPPDEHITP